ncbi:MAG: hypothetical protein ACLPSW_30290 [Roseiarcus sp.]
MLLAVERGWRPKRARRPNSIIAEIGLAPIGADTRHMDAAGTDIQTRVEQIYQPAERIGQDQRGAAFVEKCSNIINHRR